ncbi:MAG: tetratricopeptide repeat protein [Ignavibacteriae bacterium]|nr:tetratricopeptide repeat protein [Ignavibacteriota bacterium]
MKHFARHLTTFILLTVGATAFTAAQIPQELAKNWSLFSEYQRNGDHKSAVPYGWEVYKLDPKRFKTLYQKLAECYFSFYEKAETPEAKKAFADTIVIINDLGIEHAPDRASSHWLQKAYALENYFEGKRDKDAIAAYEKTLELDFKGIDFAYGDRLGQLYKNHANEDPSMKEKAIKLYQRYIDADPSNQIAVERMRTLASDPMELVAIYEKLLKSDPENIEYIWGAAQANMRAEQFAAAEKHLRKLTQKAATNATYWNELGKAQQHQRKFREAIDSYERALKLNAALKENFLNISVCWREMKNYDQARVFARRAASSDKGWGRPYIMIGEIYKAAVENCIVGSKNGDWTKLDFDDKLVYKLAQDEFAKAKATEPGLSNEVNQLTNALSTLVPTKEDYFFNKDRIVNGKIPIEGACYSWIKESVTVPAL